MKHFLAILAHMESLYDPNGNRLYLTKSEREAFLAAAVKAPRDVRSFCELLHFAGCRLSEALALSTKHIGLENRALLFEALKKRHEGVSEAVPVPDSSWITLILSTASGSARRAAMKLYGAGRL